MGPRVRQFKPGDEVYARVDDFRIGTFAQFVPVKEASLALKPTGLTMEEAASIPLVGLTAWQALIAKAGLKKGQKVFIQAGSGGVGTFAIQLAKYLGATVATTTSRANVAFVKSLGADVVIDYKTQDFEDVLRDYDVVLNSQDGKTLEKSLRVLKSGGKLISISGPPDPEFGEERGAPGFVKLVMRLLSSGVRRRAHGKAFAPLLKANGGGALLNVLSVASWVNGGELAAYSASKSAAWSLTNALRNELAVQKTQVLALHMAYVDTDLTRGFDVPKSSAEEIVKRALDGLESGLDEVLADELTLQVKRGMTAARPSYLRRPPEVEI